ncbi:hypothetical protein DFH06DRAFT_1148417 [Mycena polygramma]|nr:hypothetical protein DFH06DRAFT_1148417 [Mycena polygramma]
MHGRRRSPTEGTERRTSPGTQGKGRGMSETVGGNRAELGLEGMDQSRTKGKVQAWAKSIEERPKPRGQDFGGSTEVGEEIRSSTNQASDSDRHQEGDATGRAIGPRTQSIAERRRTEGGVGEKREEGNREMRTYCTKAAVSGTSLYGSRPRPRVSARPEGEERRWLPEPDTGEGEGCGCIGTPRVTIAGTSLYGSRPHPQGAELWSAEHREAGRLLRRGYRKRMVARVRSTTKRGREGRTTGLLVVRRRRSNPQRAGGLRRAKPGGNTGPRGRPLTSSPLQAAAPSTQQAKGTGWEFPEGLASFRQLYFQRSWSETPYGCLLYLPLHPPFKIRRPRRIERKKRRGDEIWMCARIITPPFQTLRSERSSGPNGPGPAVARYGSSGGKSSQGGISHGVPKPVQSGWASPVHKPRLMTLRTERNRKIWRRGKWRPPDDCPEGVQAQIQTIRRQAPSGAAAGTWCLSLPRAFPPKTSQISNESDKPISGPIISWLTKGPEPPGRVWKVPRTVLSPWRHNVGGGRSKESGRRHGRRSKAPSKAVSRNKGSHTVPAGSENQDAASRSEGPAITRGDMSHVET